MDDNNEKFQIRFPQSLSLADIIKLLLVVVSLTLAWGVFDTRVTMLEKTDGNYLEHIKQVETDTKENNSRIERLESHQQDDETIIDNLFDTLKKPKPTRHSRF